MILTQTASKPFSSLFFRVLIPTLLIGALGTACDSPISDVSQMSKTTGQMNQKLGGMSDSTTGLLNLTGVLDSTILHTYDGLRLGNTTQLRDGTNALKQMDEATTLQAKVAYATVYYETYEYQLWTGQQSDSTGFLDSQYLQALQEFDREVTQYIPSDLTNIDPTSMDNSMLDLYALAITMHMTNEYEVDEPALPNDDSTHTAPYHVSMLDLVESSLRAEHAVNDGRMEDSAETDWQQEGASNQQLFDALIQTRENFLSVMTLAQISEITNSKILGFIPMPQKIEGLLMETSNWDSKIPALNIDQINEYDTWIAESNRDRDFLKSVEADASLNGNVLKIYKKMNRPGPALQPKNATAGEKSAAQQRTQAGQKLWQDIQNMIKG